MDVDGGVGGEDHTGAARSDVHLQPVVGLRVRFPAAFRCGSPPPARRSPAKIAAKYAPYTNFDGTLDGFRRKSAVLAEHCRSVGTDFGAITWSANHNVAIGATEKEVQERLSWIREHLTASIGADPAERQLSGFGNLPGVGTSEQIVEELSALKAAGLSYAITYFPEAAYDTSGIELFEKEVIPALQ